MHDQRATVVVVGGQLEVVGTSVDYFSRPLDVVNRAVDSVRDRDSFEGGHLERLLGVGRLHQGAARSETAMPHPLADAVQGAQTLVYELLVSQDLVESQLLRAVQLDLLVDLVDGLVYIFHIRFQIYQSTHIFNVGLLGHFVCQLL